MSWAMRYQAKKRQRRRNFCDSASVPKALAGERTAAIVGMSDFLASATGSAKIFRTRMPHAPALRMKYDFQIELVPIDGTGCRLLNGDFGRSTTCWQHSGLTGYIDVGMCTLSVNAPKKRNCLECCDVHSESELGQSRRFRDIRGMSGSPSTTDLRLIVRHGSEGPNWTSPVVRRTVILHGHRGVRSPRARQAGTGAPCSMSLRSFDYAQNSAGILTCMEL